MRILQFIDARTELLNASAIMDQASLDPYAFQRDAYLQYREALVKDKPSGEIDYTDTANSDYNFEEYTEESTDKLTTESCTDKLTTENCKAQKISQVK